MSTFTNPVGPRSSRVYWRRRLVVLIGLLVVIGVILFLIFRPSAGDSANAPQSSPTPAASEPAASPSADPSAIDEAVEDAPCNPEFVTLEALTDSNAYPADRLPQLSFRITNVSAVSCTVDFDPTQQSFVVTSGEEQYWSSQDCQTDEPLSAPTLLEPNVPQSSTPIAWDRTRSSTTTCDTTREPVPAAGATYALTVGVGELASEPLSFILN